ILFGVSYSYFLESLENMDYTYYLKVYNLLGQNFDVFAKIGINMMSRQYFEFVPSFGFRISSYQRKSQFSFGGASYYTEVEFKATFDHQLKIEPVLFLGIEGVY
ncbi:MAG: hypothetical protein ABDH59_05425, partial [Fervidobacterium sp.]